MKIQVLGTGCPKCHELAARSEQAARELGLECEIERISDIGDIMRFGVLMTPALAVDGEVKIMGKLPAVSQIKEMLAQPEL